MAATEIAPVPGLHVAPTLDDLRDSAQCWNSLPVSRDQPDVPGQHLSMLARTLERHGMKKMLSFHLIHRHDPIDDGKVMMTSNLNILIGKWIRPMDINDINLTNTHGYLFKLGSDGRPRAYKYREGPLPDLAGVSPDFLSELNRYLQGNQLNDLLAFGVSDSMEGLIEFDLGHNGTVLLKQEQANYGKFVKETGFVYYEGEDGISQLKGNEHHAETTTGPHKVFWDGRLENEAELVKALYELGLIRYE
ncbi:uncharacterized protein FPRO_07162 [Fusarium proliferatum ET1]|uniref:Uncharacterized protein n=1 Tax=Fusarium proliferatum (strain ET1) TaxID=1227346 RepID=A0A1L7VA55_FUSPR|nr:uncharacterized protein FPRO_07162 [Fusarium proliferatum ET1]CZR37647.1 uncharacterized protein FPRO_07162 [Fusarium proliferatum ET1]